MTMKTISLLLLSLFIFINLNAKEKNIKRIKQKQISSLELCYDSDILRIPDHTLKIGITAYLNDGRKISTKGLLDGSLTWRNFRLEVDGGRFFNGKIKIKDDRAYRKGDNILVKIYDRHTDSLLCIQSIPYNFETDIEVIAKGNYRKAPGNKIDIGIRTYYDNLMHTDLWPRNNNKLEDDFLVTVNGGYIQRGNFIIYDDPFKIDNHTVSFQACLTTNASINNTFELVMDYRDNYKRTISSFSGSSGFFGSDGSSGGTGQNGGHGGHGRRGEDGDRGPDLNLFADVYFDTIINEELMYVRVENMRTNQVHNYLINTDGGDLTIASRGGDGGSGGNGGRGGNGGNGRDGEYRYYQEKINDSTYVTKKEQLPGGNGGHGGCGGDGGDGGYGGDGGDLYIHYTSYAKPYLYLINARSIPGSGGSAGWGGSGGSGGTGGSGNPSGCSGSSGSSGHSGISGNDGFSGYIEYIEVTSDP